MASRGEVSPRWRAAYRRELRQMTVRRLRVAGPLVAGVFLLDGVAELLFHPGWFWATFWVRAGVAAFALAVAVLAHRAPVERFAFFLTVVLGLSVAADIEAVILRSGGLSSPFTAGMALLTVAASLLFPFSLRGMVAVCTMLWVVYLAPIVLRDFPLETEHAWEQLFFFACATALALTASRLTADLRRHQFNSRQALAEEESKSERLLLNVLPASIAARLKRQEQKIADAFAEVTILFADIVGFTSLAADRSPGEVVALLNRVFCEFDRLTERHGLEKIKTIGDAYMVVGGLPDARPGHAEAVAEMALDMMESVRGLPVLDSAPISIRAGMNIGPVVAGVIGTKKFAYDLWGDAVNTASRMESTGVPGRIQVTQEVRDRLSGLYRFEERGRIDVKGKGPMQTYFLTGRT